MQLETYISDLLYRYECVTVPEFGAFLTQFVSAKINQNTYAFYPPKKVVSFNEQLKSNDGLLATYIAGVEKIPYETALKKIAKKVAYLKSHLVQGEHLPLKNIGVLSLNKEDKITFEPSSHLNYLTDAFGLTHFVSPSISHKVYEEEVETKAVPLISSRKRKTRPYLRYAAIALIALTIGGFGASQYYTIQVETHNELAQEEANKELENKIQEATFIINNPLPAVTLNVTKQSGNYHIVAGAFRVKNNCNKKLKQLKVQGFNARKIGKNKYGLHLVVYSSYYTRAEAWNALSKIRKNHNHEAWLLVEKLN